VTLSHEREHVFEALQRQIVSLKGDNSNLKIRDSELAAQLSRLKGRINTLERSSGKFRKHVDGMDALESLLQERLADQLREVQSVREQVEFLRGENADLQARLLLSSRGPGARLARLASRALPFGLKEPLRHLAFKSLGLVRPNSDAVHRYRQSLSGSRTSLRTQKKLFEKILAGQVDGKLDVVMMPVIDWHFRIQRPQHIAACLGALGHRVFYLTTTFSPHPGKPGFDVLESPAENVFVIQLYCPEPHPDSIYSEPPSNGVALELAAGLVLLYENFHVDLPVAIIQQPFWKSVAERLPGTLMVYDCMDHHAGFTTGTEAMDREEERLLLQADRVVTTSAKLSEIVAEKVPNVIIRNAAEVEHFVRPPSKPAVQNSRPVVGYYGAIASWFDMKLLIAMARRFPDWDFLLVGSTFESDTSEAEMMDNIRFTGEVTYESLPGYLHAFDVCTIPFQITELTLCTNPVKVYEYLSAGKPVVSTALPEVVRMDEYVHTAETEDEFAAKLEQAMLEKDDPHLARKRSSWARRQSWRRRGHDYERAVLGAYPKVSVVVLSYNNLDLLKACLHSLEKLSAYPNIELIVVDNASQDDVREFLSNYEDERPLARIEDVKIILNDENLGFAAGNNVGIRAATGEYVVLLNNDTYVTRGWIVDLIRHLRVDDKLGLLGSVTNNIGNEAKIPVEYADMNEMASAAQGYTMNHARGLLRVENVAFFCVAFRRELVDRIGYLDEDFTRGFFEDDDYCNRVRKVGLGVGIAEDVFVHHHLSASFNAMDQKDRQALFDKNRAIYEAKWGPWKPHTYRRES
jgi:GT2 family glycosyltransferase/glycosyltransferase involved in cell wall biosynthesis